MELLMLPKLIFMAQTILVLIIALNFVFTGISISLLFLWLGIEKEIKNGN